MTVAEAIKLLQRIEAKHGADVLVYFDCPKCETAFTPSTVSTAAVHVSARLAALAPSGQSSTGVSE